MRRFDYVVIDTETTGLDMDYDYPVELAAVGVNEKEDTYTILFNHLIDPEILIPSDATAVHGITNAMVHGKPTFDEIKPLIDEHLSGEVLVGHNVKFDLGMLQMQDHKHFVDTGSLVRMHKILGGRRWNLKDTCEALGIKQEKAHRALDDVITTLKVYVALKDRPAPTRFLKSSDIVGEGNQDGRFAGKNLCFTGELAIDRTSAAKLSKTHGFTIKSSVSKKLDYLIVGDNPGSKLKKANDYNSKFACDIQILGEQEFNDLLGNAA